MNRFATKFLIGLLSLYTPAFYAQCDNNVSTDPLAPTNLSLPNLPGSAAPYLQDKRFLNGFDWVNGNSDGPGNHYVLTDMFYNPPQPYYTKANLQDHQLESSFYRYLS